MPAGCIQFLFDLQCGVASALPVQAGVDDRAFPSDDVLVECRAQDPLARRGSGGPMRPGAIEIGAELRCAPILPLLLQPVQHLLVRAAVDLTPCWVRTILRLNGCALHAWEAEVVSQAGALANRLVLESNPAVQACRRMRLPPDYLYVNHNPAVSARSISAGHVKKPDLHGMRPVEFLDRLRGGLQ
jgi:hypothetical protein